MSLPIQFLCQFETAAGKLTKKAAVSLLAKITTTARHFAGPLLIVGGLLDWMNAFYMFAQHIVDIFRNVAYNEIG